MNKFKFPTVTNQLANSNFQRNMARNHHQPLAGQDAVKLGKDAFGMSDCHYLESEYTADPYLQMYPGVDAAVVPCYNLPELLVSDPPLNMSRTHSG